MKKSIYKNINEKEEMKNNAKVSRHKLLKQGDGKRNATAKVIN